MRHRHSGPRLSLYSATASGEGRGSVGGHVARPVVGVAALNSPSPWL